MDKNGHLDPVTGKTLTERRSGADRRGPTPFWAVFKSPHRRRKSRGRRKTDRGAYVDSYDSRSWSIAIAVLIMSCFDALTTGFHMARGSARELNPWMDIVISQGGLPAFFGVKAVMTVFPMAIIFIHKEWSLGRFAARVCLWSYALLTLYHLYLLLIAPLL